jgi:myo-inositol-1(or 4)-monophosphatase
MPLDLNAALVVANDLACRAGALLRDAMQLPRHIDYKGVINLVTESDRASESLIVGGLREAYPDHGIRGEEGSSIAPSGEGPHYFWHVDPLDGTTNFAHGIPHFSVSIGLAGPDGLPLIGLVYDPMRDECYSAIKGQGATLNSRLLSVSVETDLGHSVLSTGFPYDRRTNPDNNTREWLNFILRAQAVSRLGSAALDLCYVAAGRFDGFWESRLNPWDVTAGLVIVTEAGGRISNYQGGTEDLYDGRYVVASNGLIHDQILEVLALSVDPPHNLIS